MQQITALSSKPQSIQYPRSMTSSELTPTQRRRIRDYVGLSSGQQSVPIYIVGGLSAPRMWGNRGYWTTPSGKTIVHHPMAYGWRTWYHGDSREIFVGVEWVRNQIIGEQK